MPSIARNRIVGPRLIGIRIPDRPNATAFLGGIHAVHDVINLAYSILAGIAFQFFDDLCAQFAAGVWISDTCAVGGGTRSKFWV